MTINELWAELAEAPTADGLIDGYFWDSVFEEIDDLEELKEVLKKMERNGSMGRDAGSIRDEQPV